MALPIIKIDSASGSNSAASGAGPTSAIVGTGAAHTGGAATTTITLTNSPDLSGVATDGSHALWLATGSGRQFTKIVGADNGSKTLTVEDTFTIASGSPVDYAIGGKRQTLNGSGQLIASGGDLKPGWIVEFADGHEEFIANTLNIYPVGDYTNGAIIYRTEVGASVHAKLICSASTTTGFILRGTETRYQDLQILVSGALTTAIIDTTAEVTIRGCKVARHGSGTFVAAIEPAGQTEGVNLIDCEIDGTGGTGDGVNGGDGLIIQDCHIHNCGNLGVRINGSLSIAVNGNTIENCGSHGIQAAISGNFSRGASLSYNTIQNNGGDGLRMTSVVNAANGGLANTPIVKNRFLNNGGWGVNFSDASATAAAVLARGTVIHNNEFSGNSSGDISPNGVATGTYPSSGSVVVKPGARNISFGGLHIV